MLFSTVAKRTTIVNPGLLPGAFLPIDCYRVIDYDDVTAALRPMNKILIIIPAYNEEKCLAGVIEDLRSHYPTGDVVVVDDGSRDGTASVARMAGARCIRLPFNLGIGGAMQTGYQYAVAQDYDVAVQFDGDGQHVAAEIDKLLEP